jgi:hypothetical protein
MIKRSTWILLALLVLAIGAYFLFKKFPSQSSQATPTAITDNFLITKTDGVLQSLQITNNQGQTFRMQRDPSKVWVITSPSTGVADQGPASAAETQVGALRIVSSLDIPTDLGSFQLAAPVNIIELTFDNGTQHKIEVGSLTPTTSGYYVRFDTQKIYVVSQDGIDSLLNLLKSPPFPPTATPVDTDTPTETPASEASAPTSTLSAETITPTP